MRSFPFVFFACALGALGGCSSSDEPAGERVQQQVADPGCLGKSCGDSCSACSQDDPQCVESAEVKACDPDGQCVSAGAASCETEVYDPCADKSCGEQCFVCPPNDSDCLAPAVVSYCDAAGQCVSSLPVECK